MKKLIRITTVPISLDKLLGEQLRFMNQYFEVTAISADEDYLQKVADKYEVNNYHVELTRAITPIQDFKAIIQLYRFLKKEKPTMVHSHTPKAGMVGMFAAKLAGVPLRLHTVAGLPLMEIKGFKRKILDLVEKLTYASATKVYPNSKGLYDFIVEHNYTRSSKLKVIGQGSSNGIDTHYFAQEQISAEKQAQLKYELGIQPNDFVFVFVGRLVRDKGINELVEAFSKLKAQSSKLLLVGSFEAELDPLDDKTLLEIENSLNIISVGYQQDVRPYFTISNCLVFPSYREGFPNVVMQAGAMGLPSIVTDINGCNEIVIEGKNGTIIPVKNTEVLKIVMQKMKDDTNYYNQLQQNARPLIQSRYEQKVVWEAILTEYKSLVQNV